jgi:hypothetical protein
VEKQRSEEAKSREAEEQKSKAEKQRSRETNSTKKWLKWKKQTPFRKKG